MDSINRTKHKIKKIVANSKVAEDPIHAQNTLEWLLKLEAHADPALQIAALGHDIERAITDRKVSREDYPDYDAFKAAHARNSAEILKEIMQDCGVHRDVVKEVYRLVLSHEIGGDLAADLLKDADGISFFDVNLPLYFERNGWEETRMRCIWGYKRLSKNMRQIVQKISYRNKRLNSLLKEVVKMSDNSS